MDFDVVGASSLRMQRFANGVLGAAATVDVVDVSVILGRLDADDIKLLEWRKGWFLNYK